MTSYSKVYKAEYRCIHDSGSAITSPIDWFYGSTIQHCLDFIKGPSGQSLKKEKTEFIWYLWEVDVNSEELENCHKVKIVDWNGVEIVFPKDEHREYEIKGYDSEERIVFTISNHDCDLCNPPGDAPTEIVNTGLLI